MATPAAEGFGGCRRGGAFETARSVRERANQAPRASLVLPCSDVGRFGREARKSSAFISIS
jgi:hypothetical protein